MKIMRKGLTLLFSCFLFITISISLSADGRASQEGENLRRTLRFLNELPNTSFIREERSLLADYGGFGSSLLVSAIAAGADESAGTFVFAIPLDADFAIDTALAMVERFPGNPVNVLVAFLGGEKNELPKDMGGITHRGLRDLLTKTDTPENWVLCYFDAYSPPARLVISHGIRGYVTPLELITPLPSLFTPRSIPWSFRIRQNAVYKLGLVEGPEALAITWGEGVNGFVLSGVNQTGKNENGEAILPRDLADILLAYAASLDFPVLNPEKHYSFMAFPGGRFFFINELIMVALMLAAVAIFLSLYLFYSVRYNAVLLFHIRLFFRYFLIFTILLFLLVISIKLSGILYYSLATVLNTSSGTSNHAGGIVLTMLLSLLIFYFSSNVLSILRFPLRERFYKFAAVIFLFLGILSAILQDFSYIPVFLWVFTFFLLGVMVSNPVLVFVFALSLPLFALITLSNIFIADNERLTELFIGSVFRTQDSWLVIFQSSLLIFPIFLLVKRGIMLSGILLRKKQKHSDKTRSFILRLFQARLTRKNIIIPALVAVVVLAMVVQIVMPERGVSPERRFIAEGPESENKENVPHPVLTLSIEDVAFQDSRIITLHLAARGSPVRFDVSIVSRTERILLPLYSTPVPFERSDDGMRINFFLGERPPNPLVIEIVVPQDFDGSLEAAAIYNSWDPAIDLLEEPASDNYILRVSNSLYL